MTAGGQVPAVQQWQQNPCSQGVNTVELDDSTCEHLAAGIAQQLTEHPYGREAAERVERMATWAAARSAADDRIATVLRRALALYRSTTGDQL